ncbi:UNVERIFIED_CONTAM: Voltage-dependent T-type calcium channel subunit alpha-1I [Gekko kuhli]
MLVILLNCVTLGMFQPCQDSSTCKSERCTILEAFDHFIFAFFAVEMVIKMIALGIFGQKCYLGDTWNRLDFFIVIAGMMEYSLDGHNVSLSAIRTVRVLRPLRAINRVPTNSVSFLVQTAKDLPRRFLGKNKRKKNVFLVGGIVCVGNVLFETTVERFPPSRSIFRGRIPRALRGLI